MANAARLCMSGVGWLTDHTGANSGRGEQVVKMGLGARTLLLNVAALLLVSGMAPPARAEKTFPVKGGDAEEPTVVDYCPQGHYVIGFTASTGQYGIDRVQIACGALGSNGTGPVTARGPERGGATGTIVKSMCPAGMAVNRFWPILTPRGSQVQYVSFLCANPRTGRTIPGWSDSIGLSGAVADDQIVDKEDCPNGEFARGLTVNYGDRVNAMAMICEEAPTAAPAAAPDAAPPPAPPAPAAAPNPAPGAAVAAALAFQSGWQTVTDQNGHYLLVLQISNPWQYPSSDLYVTGQFINTDGATQYNGTLQGVIPRGSRMLFYDYAQPQVKAGGKGQFTLSNDGNSITGEGTTSDGTKFTWNGTRAK